MKVLRVIMGVTSRSEVEKHTNCPPSSRQYAFMNKVSQGDHNVCSQC
jgi:hypothetical protein